MPHLLSFSLSKKSQRTLPYRPALVAQGLHVPSVHSQGEKQRWAWSVEMGALGGGYTFQSPWGTAMWRGSAKNA